MEAKRNFPVQCPLEDLGTGFIFVIVYSMLSLEMGFQLGAILIIALILEIPCAKAANERVMELQNT